MAKIIKHITVTPTITAGAYTANDNVGGLMKFKDPALRGQCTIVGIALGDAAKQDASTDLVIFSANPSNSTFTDNGAQAIADADLPLIIHVENLTSYDDFSNNSVATVSSITTKVDFTEGIYAALVTRGTPTYAAITDLDITISVVYDDGE
jgi:hypothetical protein